MLYSLRLQFRISSSKRKMVLAKAIAVVPIIVVTLVCLGVGAVVPWFIKGQHKRFAINSTYKLQVLEKV